MLGTKTAATKRPSLKSRSRSLAAAARWAARNRIDQYVVPAPVERLFVRNLRKASSPLLEPRAIRWLYVDVSVIANDDAGTGIQRVVRSIRANLADACREDAQILPVVVNRRRDGYRTLDGKSLIGGPDSVFFGLDFATDSVFRYRRELTQFRRAGGRMWFMLHDILPISHPHWFTPASRVKYRRWLRICAGLAEGFLCVSTDVAGLLDGLLRRRFGLNDPPQIVTIELGSDFSAIERVVDPTALPQADGLTPLLMSEAALVVGTLEPRKGHADVLDAFDRLWASGREIPLVLIGRKGWATKALQRRIQDHPLFGKLLFWPQDVDDIALRAAYGQCRMVIVPSLAEGYGLPLDEALAHGAPVLARDIPVFQRHPGSSLAYFPQAATTSELADAIERLRLMGRRDDIAMALVRWPETARQCLAAIGCARDRSIS